MAKFKTRVWWYELHGGEVEIEADTKQQAEEYADIHTYQLVHDARDGHGASDTYSDDGDMGHDEVVKIN